MSVWRTPWATFPCMAIFAAVVAAVAGADPEAPVYDIPRLDRIVVDGKADDWGERGFRVEVMHPAGGEFRPVSNHDARVRLGWDESGLLVLATVRDDVWVEHPDQNMMWAYDSVEAFLAPARRNADLCQWVIAPGMAADQPVVRWQFYDQRRTPELKGRSTNIQAARTRMETGCVLEALLPWDSLNIKPKAGQTVAFQVWVNDADKPEGTNPWRELFYPEPGPGWARHRLHVLRLAARPSAGILARASWEFDLATLQPSVLVAARPEYAGRTVAIAQDGKVLGKGDLAADESGRATSRFDLSRLPGRKSPLKLSVSIEGGPAQQLGDEDFYRITKCQPLGAREQALRRRFGLDRPAEAMAGEPDLVQRHRGLVAWMLGWLAEPARLADDDPIRAVLDAATALSDLEQGRDYLGRQRGEFWCAYYSEADGTGQPFVITLPADYSPGKSYPLIVHLHGAGGEMHFRSAPLKPGPYIMVRPWGRGRTGYEALGEQDVLEVIAYLQRWYKIDPDRITVTGPSMGGMGSWRLASRHPDRFAAAAPLCGFDFGVPFENLRHVPIYSRHGADDWALPVSASEYCVRATQSLGYSALHQALPGEGHGYLWPYLPYDWLLEQRRPDKPSAVTYTCDTTDPGQAYWLRVRGMADPHSRAQVNARLNGQTLTLALRNVDVLELDIAAMPVRHEAELLIQAGPILRKQPPPLPDRIFVVRRGEEWSLQDSWTEADTAVRPYESGAAANLYTGEPLLIVYGTAGDVERSTLLRETSETVARFVGSGDVKSTTGRFPCKADRDVSEDDLQRYNLIVLGSARDNSLVKRLGAKLPFQVNDNNELIAGKREPVSLAGAGVRFFYYNPLAPQRLIFLIATDEQGEAAVQWLTTAPYRLTGSHGNNRVDQPDLVVETLNGAARRRMQFTHGWQWREVPGQDRPLPAAMVSVRQMDQARLRVMRRASRADYAFWWAADEKAKEYDPPWFTLADAVTASTPAPVLVCLLTGEELARIHERWIAKGEQLCEPNYQPADLDPNKEYRVAMPPWLCSRFVNEWKQNLRGVEPGPEWRPEDVWDEVFKGE